MKFSSIPILAFGANARSVRAQPVPLQNASFEDAGDLPSTDKPNANGWTATGQTARAWSDNSDWADVGVSYALDVWGNALSKAANNRVQVGAEPIYLRALQAKR